MICRICRNAENNVPHTVREMEFGTREEFTYFQCPACGCLQLDTIPDDMGRYYPDNYFAFDAAGRLGAGPFRRFIDPRRVTAHLEGRGVLGRVASRVSKPLDYLEWIDHAGIGDTSARILDVGCGSGRLLLRMRLGGFSRLLGIDPFINQEIRYPNGVAVKKQTIAELAEAGADRFDLIMFHHAFEHMAEPDAVLDAAERLLAPGGCLLIAIPVVDSHPWRRYGAHWRGIRAPRHFFLFSDRSMEILAGRHRLTIRKRIRFGNSASLIESALYAKGIPSNAPEKDKKIFTRSEFRAFDRETAQMNRNGQGDIATYYLVPGRPEDEKRP